MTDWWAELEHELLTCVEEIGLATPARGEPAPADPDRRLLTRERRRLRDHHVQIAHDARAVLIGGQRQRALGGLDGLVLLARLGF